MQELCNKTIPEINVMNCPLCGMPQEGFLNGTITDGQYLNVVKDKFYAFCNCHNIIFTDWNNMEQTVYDDTYQDKYEGQIQITDFIKSIFKKLPKKSGTFVEVGVVTDVILDYAINCFYKEAIAIDINKHTKTKYPLIVGSIDDISIPAFDVMWLSHVMEHTKNPVLVMDKILDSMSDNGCVYISMPDPWYIPLENPNQWAHLHCKEHHIMWDMDSFIDMCIGLGYECVYSRRRSIGADYHIILTKSKKVQK